MKAILSLVATSILLLSCSAFAGTGYIFSGDSLDQGSIAIHQPDSGSPFFFYFCQDTFSFTFNEQECDVLGDINGYTVEDIQELQTKLKRKEKIVQYTGPLMSVAAGVVGAFAGIGLVSGAALPVTIIVAGTTSTGLKTLYKKIAFPKESNYRIFKEVSSILNINMTSNLIIQVHNQNGLILEDYADILEIELVKLRRCSSTRRGERCRPSHERWLQENR